MKILSPWRDYKAPHLLISSMVKGNIIFTVATLGLLWESLCSIIYTLRTHICTVIPHASQCTHTNQSRREFPDLSPCLPVCFPLFYATTKEFQSVTCLTDSLSPFLAWSTHSRLCFPWSYFTAPLFPDQNNLCQKVAFCTVCHVWCEVR